MTAAHPRYARAGGFFRIRHDGSIVSTSRHSRDSANTHSISLEDRTYADSDDYKASKQAAAASSSDNYGASPIGGTTASTAAPTTASLPRYSPSYEPHYAPASSSGSSSGSSRGGCCGCGMLRILIVNQKAYFFLIFNHFLKEQKASFFHTYKFVFAHLFLKKN